MPPSVGYHGASLCLCSNISMKMSSVLWCLTTHKAAPYFLRALGPPGQTETLQGPTLSPALRPHVVPIQIGRCLDFISSASMLSVLNTFKFAYFSNLFTPFLATPVFIWRCSSLLLTFPHNECSLKYFKLRPLQPFQLSTVGLPMQRIFNSYHKISGSWYIIFY